jgi:hypothetical protein
MMERLPNYIGIGAPKAGTTWLAKCLSEHPDVFMARVKEIEFWKLADAEQRLDEYRDHFHDAAGRKAVGEYSVRYLSLPGVAERIKAVLPDVKLIVSLRNPVEQVTSNFWHMLRQGFGRGKDAGNLPSSISEALAGEDREQLLTPARYASHLAKFYRHFAPEQICVILYDDIQRDPAGVLTTLFSFLGVDPAFKPAGTHQKDSAVRQGTSPKSTRAHRMHKLVYHTLVHWIYNPLKRSIGTRRAATLKEKLRIRPVMEKLFMKKGYPAPTREEVAALRALLTPEIAEVEAMIGRDLSAWKST